MPDYEKIWGTNSSLTPHQFSDAEYLKGWESVGNTPPARQMFDALQQLNDQKAKDLNDRMSPLETNANRDYRQPSTTYAAGNITYHASLPTGYYLECTTAGTTGSGELTISSPAIGDTIQDGSVVWRVCKDYKNQNNSNKTDINNFVDDGYYAVAGFNNAPFYGYPGCILVYRIRNSADEIQTYQLAMTSDQVMAIRSRTNAAAWRPWINITTDVNSERIVAKSLGANGYIKYASGLILQWGGFAINNQSVAKLSQNITLPVSFLSPNYSLSVMQKYGDESDSEMIFRIIDEQIRSFTVTMYAAGTHPYVLGNAKWIAIGY